MINVNIYRYNPENDASPYMQSLSLPDEFRGRMVLDALEYLKKKTRRWHIDALAGRAFAVPMA